MQCVLFTISFTQYSVHCTLYTVPTMICTVNCKLYTVQWELLHCTLYIVQLVTLRTGHSVKRILTGRQEIVSIDSTQH